MELEKLFEQRNSRCKQNNYNFKRFEHDEDEYPGRYQERKNGGSFYFSYVINRIRTNRKLRHLFIAVSIFLLALIALTIIALYPLIVKIFNYIFQNGLNGIIENAKGTVEKLLNGSVK